MTRKFLLFITLSCLVSACQHPEKEQTSQERGERQEHIRHHSEGIRGTLAR